ncbi:phage baseplate assembly protein V [Parvibaculum sp.]|uniref:phage baseplate assembly protein V n=1 Tax=Parvibaculum sp. TaxID=2024848 RepID=UPI002731121F|nr:phage baseplate assembly protein V [Parvibaculum sp.]MDP1628864.1 phage baseplate assembly protein V [Parvibaculum sp.]MDP2148259.1 phage baseplate assembly protein V [Parvibaculum sp.]MDP3327744.1 phage baseplate assembly protein V [Parvibaculum sp.]
MSVARTMWNRLALMLARGILTAVDDAKKLQVVSVDLLADESRPLENFQTYGLTANAPDGLEVLAAFLGGDRSHGIVVAVGDRVYRLKGLRKGEVALYDDLGQKVHLTRDGIAVESPTEILATAPLVRVVAADRVRMETPLLEVTGEIRDLCDLPEGRTMSAMRGTFNAHTHAENDNGGPTAVPNSEM